MIDMSVDMSVSSVYKFALAIHDICALMQTSAVDSGWRKETARLKNIALRIAMTFFTPERVRDMKLMLAGEVYKTVHIIYQGTRNNSRLAAALLGMLQEDSYLPDADRPKIVALSCSKKAQNLIVKARNEAKNRHAEDAQTLLERHVLSVIHNKLLHLCEEHPNLENNPLTDIFRHQIAEIMKVLSDLINEKGVFTQRLSDCLDAWEKNTTYMLHDTVYSLDGTESLFFIRLATILSSNKFTQGVKNFLATEDSLPKLPNLNAFLQGVRALQTLLLEEMHPIKVEEIGSALTLFKELNALPSNTFINTATLTEKLAHSLFGTNTPRPIRRDKSSVIVLPIDDEYEAHSTPSQGQ